MEIGVQNGVLTNHDRDTRVNGINGNAIVKREPSPEKGKGASGISTLNGTYHGAMDVDAPQGQASSKALLSDDRSKLDDLPEEIVHITQNFMPLGLLLTRLAQKSHNAIQDKILEMAKMPLPQVMNGNSDTHSNPLDDTSEENLAKKTALLHFVQDLHAKWVKALVITEWSRKADLVSKLIDLKAHIDVQMFKYDGALDQIVDVKRNLLYARLPNPDLKTALQVLSTGDVPWMPELNYIEPPPLTPQEQLKWIDNLNTLLSIRLSLDDHDKIPFHFRDYSVSSGRVTFKVKGEFEVDLTIADEDFEKQFWFIDFRFLFTPAPKELSEGLRAFLEAKVNEALANEGLDGCYRFLHEFVLTHKINEFSRQAREMSRDRWTDSVRVERLNRAISIQYWASRYLQNGPKSWVILGVNSGRKTTNLVDAKATSSLSLRWFRDNKEVKDIDILLDSDVVSAEHLLKRVIARHVGHILRTIYDKLQSKPRFMKREAAMSLHLDKDEPMLSALEVQLTYCEKITAKIDPITGFFAMSPHSRVVYEGEHRLNYRSKDPAEEGLISIEGIRCVSTMEELNRRGKSMGWIGSPRPIKPEEVRTIVNSRDGVQSLWFKREGWDPRWYLMLSLSLSGDQWWLVELNHSQPNAQIKAYMPLPFSSTDPNLSDKFFTNLTTFATGVLSQLTDIGVLRSRRIAHVIRQVPNSQLSPQVKIPAVYVKLSEVLRASSGKRQWQKASWAADDVRIVFGGIQRFVPEDSKQRQSTASHPDKRLTVFAEARVLVSDKKKFSLLKGNVDHDVTYNPRSGQFSLRLRAEVGQSIVDSLANRLQAIDRLVDFLEAMSKHGRRLQCQSVTLRKVVFSYGDPAPEDSQTGIIATGSASRYQVVLDLARGEEISIKLQKGNPHLRVLDLLRRLVNSPIGFESLPFWLSLTLPMLRGLNLVEESWQNVQLNNQGSFTIFHRALEWLTLRFNFPSPQGKPPRQVWFDVRLKSRNEELWWFLWRSDKDKDAKDEFSSVLQPIWNDRGEHWRGLKSSAAAKTADGIEELLIKVSEALKPLTELDGSEVETKLESKGGGDVVVID
ncbi:putative mediator of rna polymerase ii transcription subunit 14 protein [Phaeoacremonium minimum UCRPA7]|uniref:Mediator of RNA polymerase II transcription subunit 14 n=1 Tax=Phaeoacremonium minimum (strain UCR-PA7) TaxID=1286976 RepID=R8BF48_PHAM7|nr:putative mediator of rna polymerase ii transcription subunit 14 protein [Phaeoacremonium minimum UCRPA7]EON97931.1 putative mediator of rna polymerase ii transcription subunit 14 protein [Phaeoacremonium minimum UCRPA7]